MSSSDYDEKIKRLFEEGAKLGASNPRHDFPGGQVNSRPQSSKATAPIASPLIVGPHRTTYSPFEPIAAAINFNTNSNNNVGQLQDPYFPPQTTPQILNLAPNGSSDMAELTRTKIHLENALQDSQVQVEYLTQKLDETKELANEQKEQFRGAVEQLQKKLQDTVAGRKQLMETRHNEMREQEEMIQKLQTTLKELATSNQLQEQALLDAHERTEIIQTRNQTSEQALNNVRALLGAAIMKENRSYSASMRDVERASELVPDVLVNNLEHYITNLQAESDSLRNRVLQLESELNATKQTFEAERVVANSDAADNLGSLKAQYARTMDQAKANTIKAQDEANSLSSQLRDFREKFHANDKELNDTRKKLQSINSQMEEMIKQHSEETAALQANVINAECDVKVEKDSVKRLKEENETHLQRIDALSQKVNELSQELNGEREQRRSLWVKESDASKEANDIKAQLEERNAEIGRLREVAAQLRGDLNTRLAREVSQAENAQRIKGEEKISELSRANTKLREDLSSARASIEGLERQIADRAVERTGAMQQLQVKEQQVERLSTQLSIADRKLAEIGEAKKSYEEKSNRCEREIFDLGKQLKDAKVDLERANAMSDERERAARQLRTEADESKESLAKWKGEAEEAQREARGLEIGLKEKTLEQERTSSLLKSKEESLEDYETRIAHLAEEKGKIAEDIRKIEKEVARIMRAKEDSDRKLEEARFQLGHLIDERDGVSKQLKATQMRYEKDTDRLGRELRRKKKELQEAQDTLYTIKNVDGKAAKMAVVMQKELTDKRAIIDSLQSELAKSCDKLEACQKALKTTKKEISALERKSDLLAAELRDANEELRKKSKNEKGYKMATERLQRALEKAAMRNAEAQAVIDRQEDEISQAKIKSGLQMIDRRRPATKAQSDPLAPPYGRTPSQPTTNENASLQNLLMRALSTMPSRDPVQAPNTTTSVLSNKTGAAPPSVNDNGNVTTNEIFKLLSEVRDQITSRDPVTSTRSSPPAAKVTKKGGRRRKQRRLSSSLDESSDLAVVLMQSDAASARSAPLEDTLTSFSDDTIRSEPRRRGGHVMTSSPNKPPLQRRRHLGAGDRPPSPVSVLLAAGDSLVPTKENAMLAPKPSFNGDRAEPAGFYDVIDKENARGRFVQGAISDNAEELCRQLQERLQGLSEMGGKLEKQNRAAANLIKKQDEKLKQVKANGRKLR